MPISRQTIVMIHAANIDVGPGTDAICSTHYIFVCAHALATSEPPTPARLNIVVPTTQTAARHALADAQEMDHSPPVTHVFLYAGNVLVVCYCERFNEKIGARCSLKWQ